MSKAEDSRIIKHRLYWEIRKGRRSSLGNRWLSHIWPNPKEEKIMFRPRFGYLNHIGPGDTAGHHFHLKKEEIFCPMGDLELILEDPKTKKVKIVKMSLGTKNWYILYYIPVGIPHAVRNRTKKFQPLVVLTNKLDLYSNTFKHQIKV